MEFTRLKERNARRLDEFRKKNAVNVMLNSNVKEIGKRKWRSRRPRCSGASERLRLHIRGRRDAVRIPEEDGDQVSGTGRGVTEVRRGVTNVLLRGGGMKTGYCRGSLTGGPRDGCARSLWFICMVIAAGGPEATRAQDSPHGKLSFACEDCHSADSWKVMPRPAKFDHRENEVRPQGAARRGGVHGSVTPA